MAKEKGRKLVAQNRKARHDYHIHDTYEAGIVLSGTEVKSLREGRANLTDAFATVDDGEVWLRSAHIPEYSHGTWTNHTARRTRKLLLNRKEINQDRARAGELGHHAGAAGPLLLRRVRQGRDRPGHRQAGVRQAPDHRHPRVQARGRAGAGRAEPGTSDHGRRPPRAVGRAQRLVRLVLALFLALSGAFAVLWAGASPAYAADDQIDSFTIDYDVQPSGVLKVTETIVWRFGDNSGRHGIERYFVIREQYDDTQDAVYTITNIDVDSPIPAWPPSSARRSTRARTAARRPSAPDRRSGRDDLRRHRDLRDLLRRHRRDAHLPERAAYDEFFWDATGIGNPAISRSSITAKVPGGAQDSSCFAGPPGSTATCDATRSTHDGTATFSQANLPAEQGVSIGVKIDPGPGRRQQAAPRARRLQADLRREARRDRPRRARPGGGRRFAAGRRALVAQERPGPAVRRSRPRHDARWPARTAHIVPSDPDLPIPVAFSPPRIPVAEAGLLIDGQVDTRETAATIIDLAVRGALTVSRARTRTTSGSPWSTRTGRGPARDGPADQPVQRPAARCHQGSVRRRAACSPPTRPCSDSVRNQVDLTRLVPQDAVGDRDRQLRIRRDRAGHLRRVLARRLGAVDPGPAAADHHHGRW